MGERVNGRRGETVKDRIDRKLSNNLTTKTLSTRRFCWRLVIGRLVDWWSGSHFAYSRFKYLRFINYKFL